MKIEVVELTKMRMMKKVSVKKMMMMIKVLLEKIMMMKVVVVKMMTREKRVMMMMWRQRDFASRQEELQKTVRDSGGRRNHLEGQQSQYCLGMVWKSQSCQGRQGNHPGGGWVLSW